MLKVCAYDVRKAPIRDLLISIHKTRDFEWQTAHTKGCQENRCAGGGGGGRDRLGCRQPFG